MALKMVDLPDHKDMVKNVLYIYTTASIEDTSEGMRWYSEAFDYCKNLSNVYDIEIERVVALVSVISPGLIWGGNCTIPEQIIDLWTRGVPYDEWVGFSIWPKNLQKAEQILNGNMSVMQGDKVKNFFANIMGETEPVTIDRWAIRCCFDDPHIQGDKIAPSGKQVYNALADVYKEVASIVGHEAPDVQAVVWTVYRYKYNGRARKERERMKEKVYATA
jgi:hypothetical protein